MSRRVAVLTFYILFHAVHGNIESLNKVLFNGDYEFFDLSHPFDNSTVYWPGNQKFIFTKQTGSFKDDGSWYATNEFAAGEHGGTHIDAPYHFLATGKHVGELELEKLIVPLIIADISSKVNEDPNFVLHKHHLDYLLDNNMGKPCVIIFKFGWSKFYSDKKYLGYDKFSKTLSFPGLSKEIAEWVTSSYKNVVGIGVDGPSVDPGSSTDYPAHKIFAQNGLYNMENVNLSEDLPAYGCTAFVMPMKIDLGTGAPLRLAAICPKRKPTTF